MAGLGGNDLGFGGPGSKGVVSKKKNLPEVDNNGDSSSGLEYHDSKSGDEDQSIDKNDNNSSVILRDVVASVLALKTFALLSFLHLVPCCIVYSMSEVDSPR